MLMSSRQSQILQIYAATLEWNRQPWINPCKLPHLRIKEIRMTMQDWTCDDAAARCGAHYPLMVKICSVRDKSLASETEPWMQPAQFSNSTDFDMPYPILGDATQAFWFQPGICNTDASKAQTGNFQINWNLPWHLYPADDMAGLT